MKGNILDIDKSKYEEYYEISKDATNKNLVDLLDYLVEYMVIDTYRKQDKYTYNWYKIYDKNCGEYEFKIDYDKLENMINYHTDSSDTSKSIASISEILVNSHYIHHPNSNSYSPDIKGKLKEIWIDKELVTKFLYKNASQEWLAYTLYHLYNLEWDNAKTLIALINSLIPKEIDSISFIIENLNKINNPVIDISSITKLCDEDIFSFWDIVINYYTKVFSIGDKKNINIHQLKADKKKNKFIVMHKASSAFKYLCLLLTYLKDKNYLSNLKNHWTLELSLNANLKKDLNSYKQIVFKKIDNIDTEYDFNFNSFQNTSTLLAICNSILQLKTHNECRIEITFTPVKAQKH